MAKRGRSLSKQTKAKNKVKAKIQKSIKNRPCRAQRVEFWKTILRSLTNWDREQARQGIKDDYLDLIGAGENKVTVTDTWKIRHQKAIKDFESRQATLKAVQISAGKQRARDRAENALSWRQTAADLLVKFLASRNAVSDSSIAVWILKQWPNDQIHKPAQDTLRRAIPSLKLVTSESQKK